MPVSVPKPLRILLFALMLAAPGQGAAAPPTEYQVKAVFLFNFARFVGWPQNAFDSADAPFVVGVFGHDPFGADLDEVVRGESVGGRPIVVRRTQTPAEAAACHIVFIHHSEARRLKELAAKLDGRNTLTVSDVPAAAERAVMIRLVTQGGRIRMRINLDAAKARQLTISSNLLRSAEIVGPGAGVR